MTRTFPTLLALLAAACLALAPAAAAQPTAKTPGAKACKGKRAKGGRCAKAVKAKPRKAVGRAAARRTCLAQRKRSRAAFLRRWGGGADRAVQRCTAAALRASVGAAPAPPAVEDEELPLEDTGDEPLEDGEDLGGEDELGEAVEEVELEPELDEED